jgi:predicted Zn finger-like uncharacterized protein
VARPDTLGGEEPGSMKITCQSCQSKYNVADEKVQGKIVKIRCRKCGATIVVNGTGAAAASGAAASDASANGTAGAGQWHVNVSDNDQRTMSLGELVSAYNAGVVTQETYIWSDGMDDWRPLAEVEAVVAALQNGQPANVSVPTPGAFGFDPAAVEAQAQQAQAQAAYELQQQQQQYEQQQYEQQQQQAAYQQQQAQAAYQTAAAPSYPPPAQQVPSYPPPGGDPYGQAAAMGQAEPRRAAVVKREARGRDLFGGGGGGEEVQTSASAVPDAVAPGAGGVTGQRNENSVLFSLAVLTQSADQRPAPTQAATKDDSGLIDLKALAAKAESMRPPAMDHDVFAAPIGMTPPPLGAPIGALGSPLGAGEAPRKSSAPLIIGMAGGFVVLLVVGIFIGMKVAGGKVVTPVASNTAAIAPPAASSAEVATDPSASASASVAASASAAPSASVATTTKKWTGGGGGYHPPPPPAGGSGGATSSGGIKPNGGSGGGGSGGGTKPRGDCGCNGDLMCLMKCSAGH